MNISQPGIKKKINIEKEIGRTDRGKFLVGELETEAVEQRNKIKREEDIQNFIFIFRLGFMSDL